MNRKNTELKDIIEILYTMEINKEKHTYQIHQWILDTKSKNMVIDHKNRNRLDNRRSNLEISTPQKNRINQTYKGYNYDKSTGKYLVRITHKGKAINLGRYDTELEAETIYLKSMMIMGKDLISAYHKQRIKELNIHLSEEDYNDNYLRKIHIIFSNSNEQIKNGKFNYNYDKNMNIIIDMVNEGNNWNEIARYLKENIKGLERAKGETVKKKYLNYINNKIA